MTTATRPTKRRRSLAVIGTTAVTAAAGCASHDPLPSWNDGPARDAIIEFTSEVTTRGADTYVPPERRVAVFDNDGTLWAEQPYYFQLLFAMDRIKELAPGHPEWRTTQPFKAALENDFRTVANSGEPGINKLILATYTGMTTDEFQRTVRRWLDSARNPTTGRPYTDMAYQPMLEVLDLFRAKGFKTYIVSGGGIDFIRVFAEELYGIPPEQIVGSSVKAEFDTSTGTPAIRRLPELDFFINHSGKPVGISTHIGRRPIAAFGNSDGDLQMLQWTHANHDAPTLCVLIHHTDAQREWAYDRDSYIGRLDAALDVAKAEGWTIVDMRRDWRVVYPPTSPTLHQLPAPAR